MNKESFSHYLTSLTGKLPIKKAPPNTSLFDVLSFQVLTQRNTVALFNLYVSHQEKFALIGLIASVCEMRSLFKPVS